MYCEKCGKFVEGPQPICEDCLAKENKNKVALQKEEPSDPNAPNVTLLSFGKALASTIMGFGAFVISSTLSARWSYIHIVSLILLAVIDVAVIVLTFVFGGKSIKTYGSFPAEAKKKPLPAFILAIIGIILAGIASVILIVCLFTKVPAMV